MSYDMLLKFSCVELYCICYRTLGTESLCRFSRDLSYGVFARILVFCGLCFSHVLLVSSMWVWQRQNNDIRLFGLERKLVFLNNLVFLWF